MRVPKLKRELTSLAGLPPAVSDFYTKGEDGIYRLDLDLEGGWSLEKDVGKLRDAVGNERSARQKLNQKLRDFGYSMGDDGEIRALGDEALDAHAAREAIKAIKNGSVKSTAELEARVKEYERKFMSDREADERRVAKAHDLLRKHFFDVEARRLIKELGGNDQTETFLMPILRDQVHVDIQEDKPPRVTVRGPDGRELISQVAGSAEPMGLAEFIRAKRTDKAFAAIWPGKAVGGSGGDTIGGGSVQGGTSESKTPSGTTEWARAALDKGFAPLHGR